MVSLDFLFKVMTFILAKNGFEVIISLHFIFKIMVFPIWVSKWIQSNNFLFKVITFANFS